MKEIVTRCKKMEMITARKGTPWLIWCNLKQRTSSANSVSFSKEKGTVQITHSFFMYIIPYHLVLILKNSPNYLPN
jgi:hypothetical protein